MSGGTRIAAIRLRCRDVAATAAFYTEAFGCIRSSAPFTDGIALDLGRQRIELARGATGPSAHAPGNAAAFQHFAMAVADMDAAMAHLGGVAGWTPISQGGPQVLPARSGGVTAFKFRDPEGRPLEFLCFPMGNVPEPWGTAAAGAKNTFLGIDHSAISVADADRAVAFYQALGFTESARQINRGPEQARLDGLGGAEAIVVTLQPSGGAAPHLELLAYRHPPPQPGAAADASALATALVLENLPGKRRTSGEISDPDGHRLLLAPAHANGITGYGTAAGRGQSAHG